MHRLNRTLSVAVVAFALAGPVFAGDVDWDFSAELMTGYDSNPLKLADDAGGGYTEGSVDFEVKADVGYRKELSARLRADTRLFAGEVSNADETHGSLDLGFEWVPIKEGHRRLILDVGADLDARRKTFTSRATGDVFEVDENGTPVPIPERFDSDRATGFVDVEWWLDNRWRLYLDNAFSLKDYVEDYESLSSVESLDYKAFTFEPGVRMRARRDLDFELSVGRTVRDYDTRTAEDESGVSVPGTTREYVYTSVDAEMRYRPNAPWKLDVGLRAVDRDDTYAGYLSYSGLTADISTRFLAGAGNRIRLYGAVRDRNYDNATINDEINGEVRSSESLTLKASFSRKVSRRLDLTVEAGYRQEDNVNSLYAYDRQWLGAWITFE